mgnify:CR=1 FL=1
MTPQDYFDRAVKHLHSMPHQAISADGTCLYLCPDGSRCVVGAFIPDGHPALGPVGFGSSVRRLADVYPDLDGVAWPHGALGRALAGALQTAHDSGAWSPDGFDEPERLRRIAFDYHLDDAVVTSRRWPR